MNYEHNLYSKLCTIKLPDAFSPILPVGLGYTFHHGIWRKPRECSTSSLNFWQRFLFWDVACCLVMFLYLFVPSDLLVIIRFLVGFVSLWFKSPVSGYSGWTLPETCPSNWRFDLGFFDKISLIYVTRHQATISHLCSFVPSEALFSWWWMFQWITIQQKGNHVFF